MTAYARKALSIDPTLAQAYALLGEVKLTYDWDWEGAEADYRKALAMNPNSAVALGYYGSYLNVMGESDEGLRMCIRAKELDPLDPGMAIMLANKYIYRRQYREAEEVIKEILSVDSTYALQHVLYGRIRFGEGRFDEAAAHYEKLLAYDERKPVLVPTRDPLGCTAPAGFTGTFWPLGVALQLETNSQAILDACRASFGPYGESPSRPRTSLLTIRLLVDESFTAIPPWPDVVFRRQGDLFYASAGSQNVAVADLLQRRAFGFISPAMAVDSDFLQRNFLDCLTLTMMTRGHGATHTYIHASAVARGNKGLILSGPCESGKNQSLGTEPQGTAAARPISTVRGDCDGD